MSSRGGPTGWQKGKTETWPADWDSDRDGRPSNQWFSDFCNPVVSDQNDFFGYKYLLFLFVFFETE